MARSWREVKGLYEELVTGGLPAQGMVRLVDHILTSQYAEGLFAWTSMHDLCVAKTPATMQDPGPVSEKFSSLRWQHRLPIHRYPN